MSVADCCFINSELFCPWVIFFLLFDPKTISFSVLYEGKERLIEGCDILDTTPQGHSANISDSASNGIFITYRRSSSKVTHTSLAVTHINVIITSKVSALDNGRTGNRLVCYEQGSK